MFNVGYCYFLPVSVHSFHHNTIEFSVAAVPFLFFINQIADAVPGNAETQAQPGGLNGKLFDKFEPSKLS